MKRRLFNLLTAASLVLCVALLALAIRSFYMPEAVYRIPSVVQRMYAPSGSLEEVVTTETISVEGATLYYEFEARVSIEGFDSSAEPDHAEWKYARLHDPRFFPRIWPSIDTTWGTEIVLPLWLPIIALSVLPLLWLCRMRKFRRRQRSNCCTACGYNLTGNVSGVCPECGTAIAPAQRRAMRT